MHGLTLKSVLTASVISLLMINLALAYQGNKVPEDKRSSLGLYFSSQEAFDYLKFNAKKTLFLDVRDPAEVAKTGTASLIDANVPYKFRREGSNDFGHKHVAYDINQDFLAAVEERRKAKGLSKSDLVILLCDCGRRASKAVDMLRDGNYTNIATVVDGFNGWRKKKLPTIQKLEQSKLYSHPR